MCHGGKWLSKTIWRNGNDFQSLGHVSANARLLCSCQLGYQTSVHLADKRQSTEDRVCVVNQSPRGEQGGFLGPFSGT